MVWYKDGFDWRGKRFMSCLLVASRDQAPVCNRIGQSFTTILVSLGTADSSLIFKLEPFLFQWTFKIANS